MKPPIVGTAAEWQDFLEKYFGSIENDSTLVFDCFEMILAKLKIASEWM